MWWLRNVWMVDPGQGIDGRRDVLVEGERVACVARNLTRDEVRSQAGGETVEIVEGQGKYLFPGLIDVHTHLREPGFEETEDIQSGAAAAIKGGFTAVLAMANTNPVLDQRALVEYVRHRGEQAGLARVLPVAAVSKGLRGEELVEMHELKEAGAVAFSDDGRPLANAEVMRLALEYAKITGLPIISHCEDPNLAQDGLMHLGAVSLRLGLKGIPASAEAAMVARDLLLAEETGGKLHLAHISSKASVELIRQAKANGVNVTAEVNPHHLIFCDEDVSLSSTSLKVNPPLRSRADRRALQEALRDGTIDMIATDHAPHAWEEKCRPLADAPCGINGLETSLAAVWQYLVEPGCLSALRLVEAWSLNPARRFGLSGGTLRPGEPADMILFDPNCREMVTRASLCSKSSNTPFLDQELQGFAVMAWVGGRLLLKNREIVRTEPPAAARRAWSEVSGETAGRTWVANA